MQLLANAVEMRAIGSKKIPNDQISYTYAFLLLGHLRLRKLKKRCAALKISLKLKKLLREMKPDQWDLNRQAQATTSASSTS